MRWGFLLVWLDNMSNSLIVTTTQNVLASPLSTPDCSCNNHGKHVFERDALAQSLGPFTLPPLVLTPCPTSPGPEASVANSAWRDAGGGK